MGLGAPAVEVGTEGGGGGDQLAHLVRGRVRVRGRGSVRVRVRQWRTYSGRCRMAEDHMRTTSNESEG